MKIKILAFIIHQMAVGWVFFEEHYIWSLYPGNSKAIIQEKRPHLVSEKRDKARNLPG